MLAKRMRVGQRAERGGPDDRAWRAGAQSRRTGGPGGQAGRTVDADLEA